jgi:ankyrin repeat protein
MSAQTTLINLMRAIADGQATHIDAMSDSVTRARLEVGASRERPTEFFLDGIEHHVYAGDTALHVAAAAYLVPLARDLVGLGAEVAAGNRRGAQPLHYAADGNPVSPRWNPTAQADTITYLISAGADPDAMAAGGVTPLHRAVRNRCAAAVRALIDGGADPGRPNANGSTPLTLTRHTTGRGGSGSARAKEQQAEIVTLLESYGSSG